MIDVETYCGICGAHCCSHTDLEYGRRAVKLTITCPDCTNEIDMLKQQISQLNDDLEEFRNATLASITMTKINKEQYK